MQLQSKVSSEIYSYKMRDNNVYRVKCSYMLEIKFTYIWSKIWGTLLKYQSEADYLLFDIGYRSFENNWSINRLFGESAWRVYNIAS